MFLAKPDESLIKHTENALKVFLSLKNAYSEVPKLCNVPHFWRNLFIAVFLHDIGKIATGFQKALKEGKRWDYRHEILSASFIGVFNLPEVDKQAISLAVITHHKDIEELREKYATYPEGNPGYRRYLEKIKEIDLCSVNEFLSSFSYFSKQYLDQLITVTLKVEDYAILENCYARYVIPYYRDFKLNNKNLLHGKYGIFLKGFLTACDHLASAGEKEIIKILENINDFVRFPKLTVVQEQAASTKGSLFLISPTGTGKTEAALLWAYANQNKDRSHRVFYVLPFIASINYMYKRFVNLFKTDEIVALLHSKAAYFIYRYFSDNLEYEAVKNIIFRRQSLARKIFRPYKIITPFQIIKSFFNLKGFEQSISEMTGGLFVFDEIHAYDPRTTALILVISRIIKKELGGKLLFMTATMPTFIKEMFKKELEIDREIKMQDEYLRTIKRHRIIVIKGDIIDNFDLINKELKKRKKVLIVVNTVKRSQEVFSKILKNGKSAVLLHSRFILRDREKIEKAALNADILVGTQAIEVSLDIDYDVLFTEPAPIDALIQRFGRVNRKGTKGITNVYIFTNGSGVGNTKRAIYDNTLVANTLDILGKIDIFDEFLAQQSVNEVYRDGYGIDEKKLFEDTKRSFYQLYSKNVPFIDTPRKESEFYALFDSVEVVPQCFIVDYINEIENKRFYEAMKYILPISTWQYAYLNREDRIGNFTYGTAAIDVHYDSVLGLQLDRDSNASILI